MHSIAWRRLYVYEVATLATLFSLHIRLWLSAREPAAGYWVSYGLDVSIGLVIYMLFIFLMTVFAHAQEFDRCLFLKVARKMLLIS